MVLRLASGRRVTLEGTGYKVAASAFRHRIARGPTDEFARSMVTCSLVVTEDDDEVYRATLVDGQPAAFGNLTFVLERLADVAEIRVTTIPA